MSEKKTIDYGISYDKTFVDCNKFEFLIDVISIKLYKNLIKTFKYN